MIWLRYSASAMPDDRVRLAAILQFDHSFLIEHLQLPEGTRIRGARWDPFGANTLELIVEHPTLRAVAEGTQIPYTTYRVVSTYEDRRF